MKTLMGRNSGTRRRKRKLSLLFKHGDHGRIEIYRLYGLYWRGWYCYPVQHSCQLRGCKRSIPITMMFCTSLSTITLPQACISNISAIFKKEYKHFSGIHQPVSLTNIAYKLSKCFMRDTLIQYMKENHLISRKQFDFLMGRSTVHHVMDKWTEIFNRQVCGSGLV